MEDLEISDGDSEPCPKPWPVEEGWHAYGKSLSSGESLCQREALSKFWKKVGIRYLVFLGIFGSSLLVIQYYGMVAVKKVPPKEISLEMITSGELQPRFFEGEWISRSEIVFQGRNGSIALMKVDSGQVVKLIGGRKLRELEAKSFSVARNRRFILLETNKEEVRNYSRYYLFEVQTKVLGSLPYFDHVSWGPKGEQMILAVKGDLYYKRRLTTSPIKISANGTTFNGLSHGVGRDPRIFWHPKGLALAYVAANLSQIEDHAIPIYGSEEEAYPRITRRKYLKGRSQLNYIETLWIVTFEAQQALTQQVMPPDEYQNSIRYIGNVQWLDLETTLVIWLSRGQDQAVISVCHLLLSTWQCDPVRHVIKWKGGLRRDDLQAMVYRGGCYLRLPLAYHVLGDLSTYWHLARVDLQSGKLRYLTEGQYNVLSIYHIVDKSGVIFYEAELKHRPGESHLMAGRIFSKEHRCLSCDLGVRCSATFHPEKSPYFLLTCQKHGVPQISVHATYNFSLVRYIEDNKDLRTKLEALQLAQVETLSFTLENGRNLSTQIYLPPINYYKKNKLPLLLEVFERRRSEAYSDSLWGHHLATTKGYVYVRLEEKDNPFETVNVATEIATHITKTMATIDPRDVAILGRSVGGYVALRSLLSSASPFTCAVAIAPITNWLYFDAEYAEALLGTVENNKEAYKSANIVDKVHKLRDKKLLLIHGTADEVVHFQNTAMLMKALTDASILYDAQLYPDVGHDLSAYYRHLLERVQYFLGHRCFTNTRVKKQDIFYKYIGI